MSLVIVVNSFNEHLVEGQTFRNFAEAKFQTVICILFNV